VLTVDPKRAGREECHADCDSVLIAKTGEYYIPLLPRRRKLRPADRKLDIVNILRSATCILGDRLKPEWKTTAINRDMTFLS
jgi:hypothetical protein